MRIEPAPVDAILPLRHRILRAGLPFDTARFPGDDDPATRHFAAYDADIATSSSSAPIVGCVSIYATPDADRPYQLRGMAVDDGQRGRGIGATLMHEVHRRYPTGSLWCNARTPAERFYQAHGWRTVSDVFDIPTAGPHVVMHGP